MLVLCPLPGLPSLAATHCQIPLSGAKTRLLLFIGCWILLISLTTRNYLSQVWFKWRNENQEIRLLGFSSGPKKKTKPKEEISAAILEVAAAGEDPSREIVVVLEESAAEAVEVHSPPFDKICTPLSQRGESSLLQRSFANPSNLVLPSSLLLPSLPQTTFTSPYFDKICTPLSQKGERSFANPSNLVLPSSLLIPHRPLKPPPPPRVSSQLQP